MYNEFLERIKESFENDSICLNIDDMRKLASNPFDELKEGQPFLPEGMHFPTEEEKRKTWNYLYGIRKEL